MALMALLLCVDNTIVQPNNKLCEFMCSGKRKLGHISYSVVCLAETTQTELDKTVYDQMIYCIIFLFALYVSVLLFMVYPPGTSSNCFSKWPQFLVQYTGLHVFVINVVYAILNVVVILVHPFIYHAA